MGKVNGKEKQTNKWHMEEGNDLSCPFLCMAIMVAPAQRQSHCDPIPFVTDPQPFTLGHFHLYFLSPENVTYSPFTSTRGQVTVYSIYLIFLRDLLSFLASSPTFEFGSL